MTSAHCISVVNSLDLQTVPPFVPLVSLEYVYYYGRTSAQFLASSEDTDPINRSPNDMVPMCQSFVRRKGLVRSQNDCRDAAQMKQQQH